MASFIHGFFSFFSIPVPSRTLKLYSSVPSALNTVFLRPRSSVHCIVSQNPGPKPWSKILAKTRPKIRGQRRTFCSATAGCQMDTCPSVLTALSRQRLAASDGLDKFYKVVSEFVYLQNPTECLQKAFQKSLPMLPETPQININKSL